MEIANTHTRTIRSVSNLDTLKNKTESSGYLLATIAEHYFLFSLPTFQFEIQFHCFSFLAYHQYLCKEE